MKTRIYIYPFHDQWIAEEMTDFQTFLNAWKLAGLRIALENLCALWTHRWPTVGGNVIPFKGRDT